MSGATEEALVAARAGDPHAFETLVARHRSELTAHCYRMLGSLQDAEDAVQETLVAAWRGIAGFEQRSSLRAWLYRIATNCCLRLATRRPRRLLSPDRAGPRSPDGELGSPVLGPVWLEPYPDDVVAEGSEQRDPAAVYAGREAVELAYVAALQHLPVNQRAVLILREVLAFSAAEVAEMLDTTTQSVNSALQRARQTVTDRVPPRSQQQELSALGADGQRSLVDAFVTAWERADVEALVGLLTEDVRFTMPSLPAWFDGRTDVVGFLSGQVFAARWRLVPVTANGQPAFACYQWDGERFTLGAVNVLSLRDGRICWIAAFLDPEAYACFGLAPELSSAG